MTENSDFETASEMESEPSIPSISEEVEEMDSETLAPAMAEPEQGPSEPSGSALPVQVRTPLRDCNLVFRYCQLGKDRHPITEAPTIWAKHICGDHYQRTVPHFCGEPCDGCETVEKLQRRYQQLGAVEICGQCPYCEDNDFIPEGVVVSRPLSLERAVREETRTAIQQPSERIPRPKNRTSTADQSNLRSLCQGQ